jgi:REP element-mobilizing transposase RayT
MTQSRETIVSVADTPYYHCVSRCVRRAFLCGQDHYSGKDYEHRRQWLEERLHHTAKAFAIKLCAYAVMSNHYHVVLHLRPDISTAWSDREVVKRWHSLFRGNLISQRYLANDVLLDTQSERLKEDIALWRERLTSPSWYMRIVNEAIARRANREDNCTGRFWEGRFKSQALLDERALLACMAYVDLNPVRAKMATSPEASEHTSVKARIMALQKNKPAPPTIAEFVGSNPEVQGLPFLLKDYLELTDWTGRLIREEHLLSGYKRGSINDELPPILERLSLNQDAWKILTTRFELEFKQWVGSEHIVRQVYSDKKYQRIPSTDHHRTLLG